MKKNLHVKSKAFISTLLIVTGIFTACKKSDQEDIAKDLSENVTSDAATEAVTDEHIPEKLTYTLSGAQGTFKVNADIYADGYGNVTTYNIKKCEKNDEWLEGYAKKFFDDGEYENVKPYMFCSQDELKQEKSFCEELLSQYEAQDSAYEVIMKEKSDIESALEAYVEDNYVKYPDNKLIYEFDTDLESQGGKVINCERAHLKGEADGKLWYMNYERGIYADIETEEAALYDDSLGCLYGVCPENIPNIMYSTSMDIGFPNKCERETAEKEAEKLLEGLGFENMKQIYISQLRVDTDADYMLDGYSITYGPSVNGIDLLYGSSAEKIIVEEQGTGVLSDNMAVQPFVKIEISGDGIFGFCIFEQYELGDVLAGSSSMLSFEQVDSQVKTVYQSLIEYNRIDTEISEIRFGYVCITYDGISYAMVPVWRYYTTYGTTPGKFPLVTVCALDGSFLYPDSTSYLIDSHYGGYEFFWMD